MYITLATYQESDNDTSSQLASLLKAEETFKEMNPIPLEKIISVKRTIANILYKSKQFEDSVN